MEEYGLDQINAFIDNCGKWDMEDEEYVMLPSGTNVKIRSLKKYFGSDDHYIELETTSADGKILIQYSTLCDCGMFSGGSYGDINMTQAEKHILTKANMIRKEKKRTHEVLPILELIFSGHQYTRNLSDLSMSITIRDMVSFGDFEDAQNIKPQMQRISFTVNGFVNTVRAFLPGTYLTTVIKSFDSCDPLVIYHHQDVDPIKIVNHIILMTDDYCDFHEDMKNSINRYDWCQLRNGDVSVTSERWDTGRKHGNTDKDNTTIQLNKMTNVIYFCRTEKAAQLRDAVFHGRVMKSRLIPELYKVLDENSNDIALAVDMAPYNSCDWLYAKAFQDRSSQKYFALVINCDMGELDSHHGGLPEVVKGNFPNKSFTTVRETKLEFEMTEFYK